MEAGLKNMHKPIIKLLSISDCRDKTGIVTFIKIFRQSAIIGKFSGYKFEMDCYRDFPNVDTDAAIRGAHTELARQRRSKPAFKQRLKETMLRNKFGAFLAFLLILCKRGLWVAIKSRFRGAAEIYFHQDFITAFWGEVFLPCRARNILVLHSGTDPLRQLFIVFHGMKGTGFELAIRRCFGWVLRKQDMVVTLSSALVSEIRKIYGVERVKCIYNTAETLGLAKRPALTENSPIEFVAVGSLQPIKGFDMLVQALALVPEAKRSRIRLNIVGEGEERVRLEQLISSAGLSEIVHLVGNSNNVPLYLSQADMFILSSRDEGMPMAVLEAMQTGLPLISTRVGTIPEVLDETACFFVEKSPESIAMAIEAVLDGENDIRKMGSESRRIYDQQLSMDLFLKNYLSVFDEVSKSRHKIWH